MKGLLLGLLTTVVASESFAVVMETTITRQAQPICKTMPVKCITPENRFAGEVYIPQYPVAQAGTQYCSPYGLPKSLADAHAFTTRLEQTCDVFYGSCGQGDVFTDLSTGCTVIKPQ